MSSKRFVLAFFLSTFATLPAAAQQFGGPLAVSGNQVFVGEASNGILPGIVYIYERGSAGWAETGQMMIAEDQGDAPEGFGRAIAADGQTLFVGAPLESEGAGAVYVYTRSGGGWSQTQRLAVMDAEAAFGSAVQMVGSTAFISAPGAGTGTIYAFTATGRQWSQAAAISVNQGARFGTRFATDGETLVGTIPGGRGAPAQVHAMMRGSNGQWQPTGQLEAEGLGERNGFGSALAVRNGQVFVGAATTNRQTGTVVVFEQGEEGWTQVDRLHPFSGSSVQFGASIHFDGDDLWVGAPRDNGGRGATYVFANPGSSGFGSVTRLMTTTDRETPGLGSSATIAGDIAVVGAGRVDGGAGAAVIFERTPAGWDERNLVVNEVRGYEAIAGDEVVCTDNEASVFDCNEVNIVSFVPAKEMGAGRGVRINDVWGWTDEDTGREYAIVGRTDGTSFVDMTDPSNPEYLGDLPKTEGSRSSIWRDMKVYNNHVYVVADAADQHGMQVFDLTRLRTVRNPPVTFEPTFTYDGIASAHNIVINEASGFAYSVGSSSGGESCGGGLHMISLENPSRPTFAGCFADPATGRRNTGYSHDAQCVTYHGPDREHQGKEICLGSNETALNIADVTDKSNPMTISTISYPNVAYTHQGWLTEDHSFFYQNDEGDEPQGLVAGTRTLVWDLRDLDDPVLVKEHIASTTDTDHNLYVRGNLMFQSNYGAGLRVLDVSDPANPVEIGFFDTTPYGGMGSWSNYPYFKSGLVIATSGSEGLFVLRATGRPALVP